MSEAFDRDTGEIAEGPAMIARVAEMPAEVATAVVAVCRAVKTLGADSRNEHQKYGYVSIDKFLEIIGPKMAEHGLVLTQDEVSAEIRAGDGGKGWLFCRYAFGLAHISGKSWGPVYRSVALQATGPQSFGSAESYMMKRFLRGIFMVPTGDRDADDEPAAEIASGGRTGQGTPAPASRAGNGASTAQRGPRGPGAASETEQQAEVKKRHAEIVNLIDGSMTAPDIDAVFTAPAFATFDRLGREAYPNAHEGVLGRLRERAEKRKADLMGEGPY